MPLSRRHFLGMSAAAMAGAAVGCDRVQRGLAGWQDPRIPEQFSTPQGTAVDAVHHLLSRCAYGPRPGDREAVTQIGGIDAWIAAQLQPAGIDDQWCDLQLWGRETLTADWFESREWRKELTYDELAAMTVIRAVNSKRQLLEVMVGFWTDHLNIAIDKDACQQWKIPDDREVLRKHALGKFPDLIRASALSPAMLVYLDQRDNKFRAFQALEGTPDKPNENYARELLELHTLGVHGGYTQQDVMEAARCLTGWTVATNGWGRGKPYFNKDWHDGGDKVVLGHAIKAGGGERDLERLLEIVCLHPSTATHLATKLCRRFVADEPPAGLVESAAAVFLKTGGDIVEVLKVILHSTEFRNTRGNRVKRPFRYVVSAMRALGADTDGGRPIVRALTRMGQAPFRYPTPDGYPDEAGPWLGTMLWRWRFAVSLAHGRLAGTEVALPALGRAVGDVQADNDGVVFGEPAALARHCLGREWTAPERAAVVQAQQSAPDRRQGWHDATAVLLASPGFQRF